MTPLYERESAINWNLEQDIISLTLGFLHCKMKSLSVVVCLSLTCPSIIEMITVVSMFYIALCESRKKCYHYKKTAGAGGLSLLEHWILSTQLCDFWLFRTVKGLFYISQHNNNVYPTSIYILQPSQEKENVQERD